MSFTRAIGRPTYIDIRFHTTQVPHCSGFLWGKAFIKDFPSISRHWRRVHTPETHTKQIWTARVSGRNNKCNNNTKKEMSPWIKQLQGRAQSALNLTELIYWVALSIIVLCCSNLSTYLNPTTTWWVLPPGQLPQISYLGILQYLSQWLIIFFFFTKPSEVLLELV